MSEKASGRRVLPSCFYFFSLLFSFLSFLLLLLRSADAILMLLRVFDSQARNQTGAFSL
jgi:lipid-A-disaccharide synthase-like uncharacterized protein